MPRGTLAAMTRLANVALREQQYGINKDRIQNVAHPFAPIPLQRGILIPEIVSRALTPKHIAAKNAIQHVRTDKNEIQTPALLLANAHVLARVKKKMKMEYVFPRRVRPDQLA